MVEYIIYLSPFNFNSVPLIVWKNSENVFMNEWKLHGTRQLYTTIHSLKKDPFNNCYRSKKPRKKASSVPFWVLCQGTYYYTLSPFFLDVGAMLYSRVILWNKMGKKTPKDVKSIHLKNLHVYHVLLITIPFFSIGFSIYIKSLL